MHIKDLDPPNLSKLDAMSYWVEIETAVGVRLNDSQNLKIITPFEFESPFNAPISIN